VFARDALKMTLAMQKNGIEFYRSAAAKNRNPAGCKVFESVAQEAEAHALQLESELEFLRQHEKGLEDAPVFLHFDPVDLQQLIPCLQANLIEGELRLDALRALEIAILMEKRAAGFFEEYAEKFSDTEGKKVFQRFAETAMTHIASIRHRAESMMSASG
jgi:rubrerythrin